MKIIAIRQFIVLAALGMLFSVPAWAATRTVTLSVPGMTCVTCPITVRKAISRVEGVEKIQVNFDKREAVVTYDDARTDVQALTQASANAGYPAVLEK